MPQEKSKTPGAIGLSQGSQGSEVAELQDFLRRFGYLHVPAEGDSFSAVRSAARAPEATPRVFDEATSAALRAYQQFHGLPVTGMLDEATIVQMSKPRCGFPDLPTLDDLAKFLAQGNRWNITDIAYGFDNVTGDLTAVQVRDAIVSALNLWSSVTPLNFREVQSSSNPELRIRFASGAHGDNNPFDGAGSVLAHAFYPPPNSGALAGDAHFDEDETWTVNIPATGIDLMTVAAHEFGHSLGLAHSSIAGALMFPTYSGPQRFLAQDDIDGIQSIYGARSQPEPSRHSIFMIQSRFGRQGNFELVIPRATGSGLAHFWRNNDDPAKPWSTPTLFGASLGKVDAVSLIQSNFDSPGNLEVIARAGDLLAFFWRDSGPAFNWAGPFTIDSGVTGNPALIQSRFGQRGNFELVVPRASGGIAHYWRNNDDPALSWSSPTVFGAGLGKVDAVALLQSNFGNPGNLEVIARIGDQLVYFSRDSGPAFNWNGPVTIASGVTGIPGLIQSRFGGRGNFELVVPRASGGIVHSWRDNDNPPFPWSSPTLFGANLGKVDSLSLLQSNFGNPGNLEVIADVGGKLAFFSRDSGLTWREAPAPASTIAASVRT